MGSSGKFVGRMSAAIRAGLRSSRRLGCLSQARGNSTSSPAIFAGTLIERRPVVLPDGEPHEELYWALSDEVLSIRATRYPDALFAAAIREQERSSEEEGESIPPAPRRTEADEQNDTRSLDRALTRTLYLMVKDGETWRFPQCSVEEDDALHTQAHKAATEQNCHVGLIARTPVCHVEKPDGSKVFYHLTELLPTIGPAYDEMSGQTEDQDGHWLTKEEVLDKLPEKNERDAMSVILYQGY